MPLIQKEVKVERESVPFRLPKELAARVALYAEFVESSRDYVVTQILQYVMSRDREFAAWCKSLVPESPAVAKAAEPEAKANGPAKSKPGAKIEPTPAPKISNSKSEEATHVPQSR